MALDTKKVSIVISLVIAAGLVGGAYYLSGPHSPFAKTASAQSTDALLKAYAAKDTDGDGLPDWEEALYGTDPNNPHSVSKSLTDGEAVAQGLVKPKFTSATATSTLAATARADAATIPGASPAPNTITDQFAKTFFEQYMQSWNGTTPTQTQINAFVQGAVADLAASDKNADAYGANQVTISGQGADALRAYAASAEAVLGTNAVKSDKSEMLYFDDAVNKNDPTALAHVAAIAKAYGAISSGLMKTPVPAEAATAHLELANATARLNKVITDMTTVQNDPMRAMLGITEYQPAVAQLIHAFADLSAVFRAEGVSLAQGQPGYYFYHAAIVVGATPPPATK